MSEWKAIPFTDALRPHRVKRPGTLAARAYSAQGRFPIVDQGQGLIAGWTNDESLVLSEDLPYVVFGDHTRTFKFVDFPFVLGADGTQLLKPSAEFNPRFFYFACLALEIPNRGYNRHFTLLKEQTLRRPPRPEQEKIAAFLLKIQKTIEVQHNLLRVARELKISTMRKLFVHGLTSEPPIETELGLVPKTWVPTTVGALGTVVTGTTPKTTERKYYDKGTLDFIAPGDLGSFTFIAHAAKRITEEGMRVSRELPKHSVCFVSIGSSIGKVGITTRERSSTNQQINAVIPHARFDPLYVCYLLTFHSSYIASHASPSPVPILSKGQFVDIPIYASEDIDEQRQIGQMLKAIDTKISLHERKRAVLDELFKNFLNKLMAGQISVSDLSIEVSEVAAC